MNSIFYNPEWMPTSEMAMLFMVQIPAGWTISEKDQVIDLIPERINYLLSESKNQGEMPHHMIEDILTIYPEMAIIESENLAQAIMNTEHWMKAERQFMLGLNMEAMLTADEAMEIYDQTSLYQYLIELSNF